MPDLTAWMALALLSWVLLPCLLGVALIMRLIPMAGPGNLALRTGLGVAVGMGLAALSLWLTSQSGLALQPWPVVAVLLLLGLACALLIESVRLLRRPVRLTAVVDSEVQAFDRQRATRLVLAVLIGLVSLRVVSILPDVLMRPLFPWDAWQTWAWKARVWFEAGELVPILAHGEWRSAGAGQYVIKGTNHPDFISLLLLWSALIPGHWNDSLIGMPWLLCGVASALLLYGLVRASGLPRVMGWLAVYLLASLPMVTTHIALFGYADLWMMLYFLTFTSGLLMWVRSGGWPWLVLMGLSGLVLFLTKDTGSYWLPVLLLAVVASMLSYRTLMWAFGVVAVAGMGILITGLDPFGAVTDGRFRLDWQPLAPTLAGISRHLFVWLEWHLLWYAFPIVLVAGLFRARDYPEIRVLVVLVMLALGATLLSFVATRAGEFAVIGTVLSRVLLQSVPVVILLSVFVAWNWVRGRHAGGEEGDLASSAR